MKIEISEALWLDAGTELTLAEIAERSGLSPDILRQLVELDILSPGDNSNATFSAECLVRARTARRLRDDFELDAGALALVMGLIERVHELESQMHALQARLPRNLL